MNWGYKILFVYLAFVAGILVLVFKASGEKDDLVTADYYAQELKYQQRIDETNRTNALSAELQYEVTSGKLLVHFPKDFAGKKISGNVLLYCPANEDKDLKQNFAVQDEAVSLVIPPGHTGAYEIQMNWQADGLDYYYQKKIFL